MKNALQLCRQCRLHGEGHLTRLCQVGYMCVLATAKTKLMFGRDIEQKGKEGE